MNMSWAFAMPSRDTLSIPCIASWVQEHLARAECVVDPFARNSRVGTLRNDLDPATSAEHHMDAEAFCLMLAERGVKADAAIFDPPYSPRQISEHYRAAGRECGAQDTQNARLYKRVRDALNPVLKDGASVLSFGWHSNGMGVGRRYDACSLLIVRHGGAHNDTICLAERKQSDLLTMAAE